jgi:peptide chain release factor 1
MGKAGKILDFLYNNNFPCTLKWRVGIIFSSTIVESYEGFVSLNIVGKNAFDIFKNESGTHQWHRVPPTEKGDRVHTSVISVAITMLKEFENISLNDRDLDISTTRGSGKGGQHRNKTETAVIVKHIPSGITVRCESERSQLQNKTIALQILESRINHNREKIFLQEVNASKKKQFGTGNRAEKQRTYKVKNNIIVERDGSRKDLRKWMKGDW